MIMKPINVIEAARMHALEALVFVRAHALAHARAHALARSRARAPSHLPEQMLPIIQISRIEETCVKHRKMKRN